MNEVRNLLKCKWVGGDMHFFFFLQFLKMYSFVMV